MSTVIKYTLNDAEELIRDIGGYDPITEAKDLLNKAESDEQFSEYLDRRINNHEPVAYITNHARFGGIDLYIDPRVLIPRSETEALLQVAIDEAQMRNLIRSTITSSY